MRNILPRNEFKRDFRRALKGRYRNLLAKDGEFDRIKEKLANDEPLEFSYRDHALHHNWEGCRECHIKSDFLLVYSYDGEDWLILERLGTHSDIFGL